MKKLIISVLSVLILFNFILPKNTCQASISDNVNDFKNFALSSTVTVQTASPFLTSINLSKLSVANAVDKVVQFVSFPFKLVNYLIGVTINELGKMSYDMFIQYASSQEVQEYELNNTTSDSKEPGAIKKFFNTLIWGDFTKDNEEMSDEEKAKKEQQANRYSIENLILGKYEVLDINFINGDKSTANYWLKSNVQFFYNIIRRISIVGSLMALIYIGIRTAISTVAEEKAKYKKYLTDWAIALCLIFIMHYIILIIIAIEGVMANVLAVFYNGNVLIESEVLDNLESIIIDNHGWAVIADFMIWIVIMYYQISFFFKYFKRMLKMAFLTIISPLITLTYSLGNKGAFKSWLKEVILLIFMPIIHGFTFIVFMISASEIIKKAPVLTIIMFFAMNKGEKIVRNTFNLNGDESQEMGKFKLNPFKK